jgi:hypothetical protein
MFVSFPQKSFNLNISACYVAESISAAIFFDAIIFSKIKGGMID